MKLLETTIKGLIILEPEVYEDKRGFFMESYNKNNFQKLGFNYEIVQDNHSLSTQPGVIRGLHYQLNPKAQTKIVRVLTGAIYDVVVDIRKSSPTFGQWIGINISEYNKRQIVIPKGFAHGFCTLVPNTSVLYKVDEYYSPEHDSGIFWNDPYLKIDWPFTNPIVSEKDQLLPYFEEAKMNFE